MADFDIPQWCDYVRGVTSPEDEPALRERLESDPGARRTVEALSRVKAVADADAAMAIPDYAVRVAKAAPSVRRSETEVPEPSLWRFLDFRITFDSLRQPSLAGIRDLEASYRQLTFQTEGHSLEVRMEHDVEPQGTVVIGQILKLAGEPTPMATIPVLMVSEGRVVDRSLTSRFGEFHAEGLPKDTTLYLFALVEEDSCLAVPLDEDELAAVPLSPSGETA